METREVTLRRGITVDGVKHATAVVREMSVDDVLLANEPTIVQIAGNAIPVPPSANLVQVRLMSQRVIRIGSIEMPGSIHIKTLAFDDSGRIDAKMEELDKELAAWAPETPKPGR